LVEASVDPGFEMDAWVSIPERVLGWLKLEVALLGHSNPQVSIPERVLGWLKPESALMPYPKSLFQSLKGFWVG